MLVLFVVVGVELFGIFGGNGDCVWIGGVLFVVGVVGGGFGLVLVVVRVEILGSWCCKDGDLVGVVELGLEIGFMGGGVRICVVFFMM